MGSEPPRCDPTLDPSDPLSLMFAHAERWMKRARAAEAELDRLRGVIAGPPASASFWESVHGLARLRRRIPAERRELSAARNTLPEDLRDPTPNSTQEDSDGE